MAGSRPRLILATRNQDKLREIRAVLADLNLRILSMDDFRDFPEVEETGATLIENAIKKAKEIFQFTGLPALADDTGLEVEALDGQPGVYSSRFAGENATYHDNVVKLLRELENTPQSARSARFRTVMALVCDEKVFTVEGIQEGEILFEPRGESGFGYDPVFFIPEYKQTFAEMPLELKNSISHRGKALVKMKAVLADHFNEVFHAKK